MRTYYRELKVSLQFPAARNERWQVRNGAGRVVETWRVMSVADNKTARYINVEITDHGVLA